MIETTKLENGLTVISERYHHIESVAIGVWVRAGSRNELADEHGISHLLEHMAFKGTKTRSAEDIAVQIESVGGEINAATSYETTAYFSRVLKKDVELAIDILSDILTNSVFEKKELQREKHVILQELGAMQDNPEEVVYQNFQQKAFGNQALGRSILGSKKSIEKITRTHLKKYLSKHYCTNNMVVVVVGNVPHKTITRQIELGFANLASKKSATKPEPAKYIGGERHVKRHDLQEAQIILGYEGRGFHAKEFYASQILATILGGGMSSRLFQSVREQHGLCYAIYAMHTAYNDSGIFSIYASTGEKDVEQLMELIRFELVKTRLAIPEHELNSAREQIRASLLMAQENPLVRASQLAKQFLFFGRHIENEEIMQRLNAITSSKLTDLMEKMSTSKNATLASIGPIKNMVSKKEFVTRLQR